MTPVERPSKEFTVRLPWPPSVNHYYRRWRGGVARTKEVREYHERVSQYLLVHRSPRFVGPVALALLVYPPDRKKRDLDNLLKGVCDAIEAYGLVEDDAAIEELYVLRRRLAPPSGRVIVKVWPLAKEEE